MSSPFPSKEQILEFIADSPGRVGKREISRAFRLDAGQRIRLKRVLRELEAEAGLGGKRKRRYSGGKLPPVTVLEISGTDVDGEVLAKPIDWDEDEAPPVIYVAPDKRTASALGPGDRVLARLAPSGDVYEARVIRRLAEAPSLVLGVFAVDGGQGRIRPANRRVKSELMVATGDSLDAEPGDLVRAEVLPGRRLGLRKARVVERLSGSAARNVSMIAIHDHAIPTEFTAAALKQAEDAGPAKLGKRPNLRQDLRKTSLVTIDGADARDFDDAVWAEADGDAKNPGGYKLLVAIADVSWYVRPGDALDTGAYERGNSVYFPDRVVPMLPEALSNGWCSLVPGEDRPCVACHMTIDAQGKPLSSRFTRGLMRSAARLTYEQLQQARDGEPDETTAPLMATVVGPLYGAYEALSRARQKRGVLELDLPERRVVLNEDGEVSDIRLRPRHDSHKLIEEFMIAANVAAAETLTKLRKPCMFRNHGEPSQEKVGDLRRFLATIGINLAKAQVLTPALFNRVLEKAAATPHKRVVPQVVLRAQARAEYAPANIGHFGLALKKYGHFTSPIRRYADLLVHRALISACALGEGGLPDEPGDYAKMGDHLSATEQRAAAAERDAVDRFTAAYLAEHVGARFKGCINGVTRFGLFVTLDDTGADGLVPASSLPGERYHHDEARHVLRQGHGGREFRLGQQVEVVLAEANPISGGLIMNLAENGNGATPKTGKKRPTAAKGHKRRRKKNR